MKAFILALHPGMSNDEIKDHIRHLDGLRATKVVDDIGCTISGFGGDPRELADIPEARAFAVRVCNNGFLAPLSSTAPRTGTLGALDLWLIAEGFNRDRFIACDIDELTGRFLKAVQVANAQADVLTLVDRMSRSTLTDEQRINLAVKVVEYEQAETRAEMVARLAALIKYVAAEHILAREIKKTDRGTDRLVPAITAATVFENPTDFPAGSLGGDALVAAGFASGPAETADEEPETPRDTTTSPADFPF